MRRKIQIIGWILIWNGVLVFGVLGWQLFGTDLLTAQVQAAAVERLDIVFVEARQDLPEVEEIDVEEIDETTPTSVIVEPPPVVSLYPEYAVDEGTEFAPFRIPKVGLDVIVFEGVTTSTLKLGPGHMPDTALPGQPGNAVISGHRTTYGSPFFDLDLLEPGDVIEVETAIGVHTYEVRESFVVEPTGVWVTDPRDGAWLTLTTCNPKYSAREGLIITAELVDGPNFEYVASQNGQ